MKIWNYSSYQEYKDNQIRGNRNKIKNSFVDPVSIDMICNYIFKLQTPKFILCHGTRQGLEQQYFKQSFAKLNVDINVLGTEISPTAINFPNTIEWDFHNVKDEWVSNVDIVYSNSIDHSYKPYDCLKAWMSCLNKDGLCILEYSIVCNKVFDPIDPFASTLEEFTEFVSADYELVDVLTNDSLQDLGHSHKGIRHFFILRNK
jgi:hypothetical protein